MAGWTGIAAFVGQNESEWLQASHISRANIDFFGMRVEEKSAVDLRIGARAGQFDLRLFDPLNVVSAEKYNGQFLSFYLRWPIKLAKEVKLHSIVNYQLNLGEKSGDTENTEISWSEVTVNVGLSIQLGLLSIRPFIDFHSIDGDITSDTQSRFFQQDATGSYGLTLDLFVERSAFVRLKATTGSNQSILISFAREY